MAQSVARLVRNEKVRGSSPLSSTIFNMALTRSFVLMAAQLDSPVLLACAPGVAVDTVLGPSSQRLRRSGLLHRVCGSPRSPRSMPAGVAGFHGKEPLFGPVRQGEHTLPVV
jgi:hypothetical protein